MAAAGEGLTVTVNVITGPGQPAVCVAVTCTVAVPAIAVNAGIAPVPLNPKPTFCELVQFIVVPAIMLPQLR